MELNLLISLAGILGAGLSSYLGVKIAVAELRKDIQRIDHITEGHGDRLERLERPYFNRTGDR